MMIAEEDEQGTITLPEESEEQLPEQVSHDLEITESPMVIDQEDQQIKSEHPLEEAFPGADNIIPQVPEGEEEEVHGMIEHATQEHIPSTEKPEQQSEDQANTTLPTDENIVPETKIEAAEKEFTPSHEHITEISPVEVTPEEVITTKVPSEIEAMKTEVPTNVQEIKGATEAAVELTSSTSQTLQPEEEAITIEHKTEEHTSTEESSVEKEYTPVVTEKEQPTEPSVSEERTTETQTTEEVIKIKSEEATSPHEELPAQIPEEMIEKATEGGQVGITEAPERPEISTDIVEKATSPIMKAEEPSSIESVTEQVKEDENEVQTTSGETHAMEIPSGLSEEQETVTTDNEISSIEQIITEKGEVSHLTETAVTEETQPTEINGRPEESSTQQEQKPVTSEDEKEQRPEQPISEHTIVEEEHITSEEPIFMEGQQEETSSEIPAQGPTGIPIPERSPEQKAEDENIYHVTEDYHGVKHPEISPDNLMTESPQETSETSSSQEEEATLIPSKEVVKPSLEESTEITLSSQAEGKSEIIQTSTSAEETKEESTSVVTEIQGSTESSTTTITTYQEHVPEEKIHEETEETNVPIEIETKAPQMGIQLTEKVPGSEELPTKGLGVEESGEASSEEVSDEQIEKEVQPKIEQSSEKETQPSIAMQPEAVSEIPISTISVEHEQSTESIDIDKKQTLHGEHITTVIPIHDQSTRAPQGEEKETGTTFVEEIPVTTEKSMEKPISEQSTIIPGISGEEEKGLDTEKSVLEEEQTTETIKTVEERIEKSTTQASIIEENKTEQPEQYSTEKAPEEVAITEGHDVQEIKTPAIEEKPEEIEGTPILLGITEGSIEAMITEKGLPKETKQEPMEVTDVERTELPVIEEHITVPGEIEKESEEKTLVPVSMQETEAPIISIGSTEVSTEQQQIEEMHTEPSVSEEHLPSQPSIPSDRKEDQESVEPKPSEEEQEIQEHVTQKLPLEEEEVTEIEKEPQEPTIPSEMEATYAPSSEETITESALPETKPNETTEFVGINEIATQSTVEKQPEIVSEQAEEVSTELSGSEEQTQSPITEEQPELHVRKETEAPNLVTPIESFITPSSTTSKEITGEEGVVSKSTETVISESTTVPVLISEVSTVPQFEENTEHEGEVSIEKETVTEFTSAEKGQPDITQPSITEEKLDQEEGEAEVTSPEEPKEEIIPEMPKIPIIEEHSYKPEEEEILKETISEMPIHEEHSTIAPEEIPEVKITTEAPLKEVPQYSTEYPTNIPEETSEEEEIMPEIILRPSGIPGEGNCLVEGQSYNNNSAVPPANICQTSCRCISSIVQCELVECPAPPAHLSNCMPIHTGGESCCPMYACDSTPTVELESDNHMVEPHTPEAEEGKKDVLSMETSTEASTEETVTEAVKESSTITGKISTSESQPVTEVTIPSISPSEEAEMTETEKQTTLKSILYEQSITTGQPVEQHTISSISETSIGQEFEKEETKLPIVPSETTESTMSEEEESVTKALVEQPLKEIVVSISDEDMITSTHEPVELEPHDAEKEGSTVPHKEGEEEEVTIPILTKEEEIHIPAETTTIIAGKEEETTVSIKEEEVPTEKIDIKEQSTPKPIGESEEEQPIKEEIQPTASEESATVKEMSTELEESIVTKEPMKSEVVEEQHTIKSTEYETTSVPEIQSTTAYKSEEREQITLFENEQTTQAEKSESQTKLPDIVSSEAETQKPIVSIPESTTFVSHDYTETELPLSHMSTKFVEASTEESKEETEPEVPGVKEEHVTIPIPIEISNKETTEQELEKSSEETIKPSEESIPEVSHEETSPEITTESAVEITEHVETYTESSLADHEKEPSVTKLPEEENPAESESPASTEYPVKAVEVEEVELERTTEASIVHEPESTEVSAEEHPVITPETESHVPELSTQEHTKVEEETTAAAPAQEEIGEQFVTPIIKETEPSLSEAEPEQSEIESNVPEHVEHVTVTIEEQTPKSEEYPIEKQTTFSIPSKSETTEAILAEEATTESVSQKEQMTEKSTESVKPETELPIMEKETITPEIQKEVEEEEQQKPETEIIEQVGKEEPVTEVTEVITEGKEGTTEAIKEEVASTTEEHLSTEEHPEQEATSPEPGIKIHEPMEPETTNVPIEEQPEEEPQASEASLPEQPTSDKVTTVASLISEEHLTVSTETKEEEDAEKSEHQTTLFSTEEEVTRPVTEVEKLSSEEESSTTEAATAASVEVSPSEKPADVLPETGRPIVSEQETELPEQQDEVTTKTIESVVTEKESLEETVPAEIIPKTEEKPSETPSEVSEEIEHSTVMIETTSIRGEEEPSITKLQPTEESIPSDEKIPESEEVQPSQTEEAHPSIPEEGHPISTAVPEEPQFTTEHMVEVPVTIKKEEYPETEEPEISSEAATQPAVNAIEVSGAPTESSEEQITTRPVLPEEPMPEVSIRPEESPQSTELPVEQHVVKIQPELSTTETPEEIPEEEIVHPQEEEIVSHPHVDHFPEVTTKPELGYTAEGESTPGSERPVNHTAEVTKRPSVHEEQPMTTLTPHIPEYPDQIVSGEDNPHFPVQGGSYLNHDEDYDEDDQIYGPGTCRYGGKVYVSAQQIPRDDPCDFCFCFRSDIICLQQSCPPPIPGCHEEPISGFCCPRYECPVSMATALNLTTTTTTTTTTLPPHFHAHAYKGAARRNGCLISGKAYRVGEVIKSASGPCLHCT